MGHRRVASRTGLVALIACRVCVARASILESLGSAKLSLDIKSGASISADADTLLADGQSFAVSWSGIVLACCTSE